MQKFSILMVLINSANLPEMPSINKTYKNIFSMYETQLEHLEVPRTVTEGACNFKSIDKTYSKRPLCDADLHLCHGSLLGPSQDTLR